MTANALYIWVATSQARIIYKCNLLYIHMDVLYTYYAPHGVYGVKRISRSAEKK